MDNKILFLVFGWMYYAMFGAFAVKCIGWNNGLLLVFDICLLGTITGVMYSRRERIDNVA